MVRHQEPRARSTPEQKETTACDEIPYAETREETERHKRAFQAWCRTHGHVEVGRTLDRGWERMVTFDQFPREHWKHLRTSNPVVENLTYNIRGGQNCVRYSATNPYSAEAAKAGWWNHRVYVVDNTIVNSDKGISFCGRATTRSQETSLPRSVSQ